LLLVTIIMERGIRMIHGESILIISLLVLLAATIYPGDETIRLFYFVVGGFFLGAGVTIIGVEVIDRQNKGGESK